MGSPTLSIPHVPMHVYTSVFVLTYRSKWATHETMCHITVATYYSCGTCSIAVLLKAHPLDNFPPLLIFEANPVDL